MNIKSQNNKIFQKRTSILYKVFKTTKVENTNGIHISQNMQKRKRKKKKKLKNTKKKKLI